MACADETGRGGVRAGIGVGKVVRDSAVSEGVVARFRDLEVAGSNCKRVHGTGERILRVGPRRSGRHKQRRIRRRQRRSPGQRGIRLFRRRQRKRGCRLQRWLDHRDVDAGADDKHGVRAPR